MGASCSWEVRFSLLALLALSSAPHTSISQLTPAINAMSMPCHLNASCCAYPCTQVCQHQQLIVIGSCSYFITKTHLHEQTPDARQSPCPLHIPFTPDPGHSTLGGNFIKAAVKRGGDSWTNLVARFSVKARKTLARS